MQTTPRTKTDVADRRFVKWALPICTVLLAGSLVLTYYLSYKPNADDVANQIKAVCDVTSRQMRNGTCTKVTQRRYKGVTITDKTTVPCWVIDLQWHVTPPPSKQVKTDHFSQHIVIEVDKPTATTTPQPNWAYITRPSPAFGEDPDAYRAAQLRKGSTLPCWYLPRKDTTSFTSYSLDLAASVGVLIIVGGIGGLFELVFVLMAIHMFVRPFWKPFLPLSAIQLAQRARVSSAV
ncbi:Hypothetical protein POVN_LOCUS561 [uncultured virus]|nr:Hypothetical protein POVN_LOCUS561 [uncultured virus]